MKYLLALLLLWQFANAQTLTVDNIMRDPKWIGSSPSNVYWSADSKTIFFQWNPLQKTADSTYGFTLNSKEPVAITYNNALLANAINNGVYNKKFSQLAYIYKGDVYLLDIKLNHTTRITQTAAAESSPAFVINDEWVAYEVDDDFYAWNIATGITRQLTAFTKGSAKTKKDSLEAQQQELKTEQLSLFDVLKERRKKREERDSILKRSKDADTLHLLYTGDKTLQNTAISPDARFVTYRLFKAADDVKHTAVPDYVTETGFTTDIPGRTKVGAQQGKYEFYLFDRLKDTVIQVALDSLPGITDQPDYVKDYPAKYKDAKPKARPVIVSGPYWNEDGTAAIIDIRSLDNKDRWLMQLLPTGKLKLVDRQRDEAWIAGPGIGWGFGGGANGWIDANRFYFQSEATGYSHLYVYNIATGNKQQLTYGNYEVQQVRLSRDKKMFYLLTNETHPGKQHYYRIRTDGTGKEQLTSLEGGYEVSLSPDEKYIAYRYSYINKPWELYVQENAPQKKPQQVTAKGMSDEFKAYPWRQTKIFTIAARDGKSIYARLYEPAEGKKNGAAVIFVHGAGYLQNVHYWFSSYFREYMFNNLLADKGYTVLDIDYRASSGYGRDWRTGIYRYMGGKDLDDEVDAARYLVKDMGIDAGRIGIYGGSYGGFMTLMGLFTQPTVFKAGAALRPVTDWAHYNHGYTSNILNEPFKDSIAYHRSSPINFAAGLQNHLLICHGMVDVNVHFQDVVRLSQRLIELKKSNWELAVYPVEDHGFVEPSSWADEYKRILKLFDTQLLK
ncbi:S9 family peptidase [Foetidibacter luteolus]|uniref:S9 family peptidase n=1 Tax=Foetidibacter luteolus TaxID=2608880 RepID=UPI00129B0EA6|nr:prolyl oligopeptidase family serine peptidase [Foetidibacter luteolus]